MKQLTPETIWNAKYSALKNWLEKYSSMPGKSDNKSIYYWINTQRINFEKGKLSEEYINKLNEIGFSWTASEEKKNVFLKIVSDLKKWRLENNRWPKESIDKNESILARKIIKIYLAERRGTLDESIKNELVNIGYEFSTNDKLWEKKYSEFKLWIEKNNKYPSENENGELYNWFCMQRHKKAKSLLSDYRIKKLNDIGFIWSSQETNWKKNLNELKMWHIKNKFCWPSVRAHKSPEEYQLGLWLMKINSDYKNNLLSNQKIKSLLDVGYIFKDRIWQNNYDELLEFIRLKKEFPKTNNKLYTFCSREMKKYLEDKMPEEHVHLFRSIGFFEQFRINGKFSFEVCFKVFIEYVKKNKHFPKNTLTIIGDYSIDSHSFQTLINNKYIKNKLDDNTLHELRSIDFPFRQRETNEHKWNSHFEKLRNFRCSYPDRWPLSSIESENRLYLWCLFQRQHYNGKKSKLYGPYPIERKEKLDSIGFEWGFKGSKWEENYEKYTKLIEDNPTGKIPWKVNGKINPLYLWYYDQISLFRRNKLAKHKLELLKKTGNSVFN
jgi:hypothetical protein